jgi:cell division septation protein DedD
MPSRSIRSIKGHAAHRFVHAIAAAAVLVPSASHAGNAPLAVALEYAVPAGCPDESEFKSIVVGRLGYGAFREDVPDRALVHVAPHGKTLEGRIEWQDAAGQWQGERTFPSRSGDCDQLVRAMAFALALQIQLLAHTASSPESPPPTTELVEDKAAREPPPGAEKPAAPKQPPAPPPTPATEEPAAPARPLAFAVGIGGLAAVGMSNELTPLGRVFGSVAWRALSIDLAAEMGPASTIRREDGAGFSHREILAALAVCGGLDRWSLCLVGKGGQIRIHGEGVDNPTSLSGAYLQTGLRLAVRQDLGSHFFLRAQAEGLATVNRPRVALDKLPVWTAQRFAETLGLDLGVRFQ